MVCHDMGSSACWHAQAPMCTDCEAALPFWQICLEVAREAVGGLVVDALPLQNAALPGAPEATPLGVPVHSLSNRLCIVMKAEAWGRPTAAKQCPLVYTLLAAGPNLPLYAGCSAWHCM